MSNENSNINENEEKKVEKSEPLTPEEKEERNENIIVMTILWLTTVGLFIAVIGVIWRIKDLFTETGWEEFLLLSIQTQIFIVGLILLGIFFLTLFLVVLYRRGKRSMHNMLFKEGVATSNVATRHAVGFKNSIAKNGVLDEGGLVLYSAIE